MAVRELMPNRGAGAEMEIDYPATGAASMAMSFGAGSKLRFLYRSWAILMGLASTVAALPVAALSFGSYGIALLLGRVRPLPRCQYLRSSSFWGNLDCCW